MSHLLHILESVTFIIHTLESVTFITHTLESVTFIIHTLESVTFITHTLESVTFIIHTLLECHVYYTPRNFARFDLYDIHFNLYKFWLRHVSMVSTTFPITKIKTIISRLSRPNFPTYQDLFVPGASKDSI